MEIGHRDVVPLRPLGFLYQAENQGPINLNIGPEGVDVKFSAKIEARMVDRLLYGEMEPCKNPGHFKAHVKHHRDKEVFELFGRQ